MDFFEQQERARRQTRLLLTPPFVEALESQPST